MFMDLIFMFICFMYLLIGGALVVAIDFIAYLFIGNSPLLVIEKFLFDKLGN